MHIVGYVQYVSYQRSKIGSAWDVALKNIVNIVDIKLQTLIFTMELVSYLKSESLGIMDSREIDFVLL